jgi:hypothetical protein
MGKTSHPSYLALTALLARGDYLSDSVRESLNNFYAVCILCNYFLLPVSVLSTTFGENANLFQLC